MLGLQEFVCLSKCLLWTSVYSSVTIHTRTCTSTITVMSHACLYLCTFVLSDIMYTSNHNSHTHLAITAPPPSNPTMPKLCAETEQWNASQPCWRSPMWYNDVSMGYWLQTTGFNFTTFTHVHVNIHKERGAVWGAGGSTNYTKWNKLETWNPIPTCAYILLFSCIDTTQRGVEACELGPAMYITKPKSLTKISKVLVNTYSCVPSIAGLLTFGEYETVVNLNLAVGKR